MYKFSKNYEADLRYVNTNGDSMFVTSSCHDRIANTASVNRSEKISKSGKKELHIGTIGAFDSIV